MESLRGTKLKAELRGALVATEFRSCEVLNNVRNAADCRGVISALAVVEYPDRTWALRGGFNIWQSAPSADFPVSVTVEGDSVTLVVPQGFQPRQGELRHNDRAVDHHFTAITATVKRRAADLVLS